MVSSAIFGQFLQGKMWVTFSQNGGQFTQSVSKKTLPSQKLRRVFRTSGYRKMKWLPNPRDKAIARSFGKFGIARQLSLEGAIFERCADDEYHSEKRDHAKSTERIE